MLLDDFLYFHVFNRSIAGYQIYRSDSSRNRFYQLLDYYNHKIIKYPYSQFLLLNEREHEVYLPQPLIPHDDGSIKLLAYCIMPDHYHLLIKTPKTKFLSKYINDIENSFSKYFNIRNKRKGPLWQSRFQRKRIKDNDTLLHVSRYIHLNPVSASLADKPENWQYSSYSFYTDSNNNLRYYLPEISINDPGCYRRFTEDNLNYQKHLKIIRKSLLE